MNDSALQPLQGEFGIVALDPRPGTTWFSLRSMREYATRFQAWDETLAARLVENPLLYEGQQMPAFPSTLLPDTDLNALIAYLKQIASQRGR